MIPDGSTSRASIQMKRGRGTTPPEGDGWVFATWQAELKAILKRIKTACKTRRSPPTVDRAGTVRFETLHEA